MGGFNTRAWTSHELRHEAAETEGRPGLAGKRIWQNVQKSFRQGRSERKPEAYYGMYVEGLSDRERSQKAFSTS